ncbi:MAG TPA: hypothetical protein VF894_16190 [Anaeromyxobacter sp.]
MLSGSTLTAIAAIAAWTALVVVGGLRVLGVEVSFAVAATCAALAGPVAITASIQSATGLWRGPDIETFSRTEAVACAPGGEAGAVRAGAQIRGTMGGAGYLYPRRLALPAIAWVAAAVAGAEGVVPAVLALAGPWPILAALTAGFAAFAFPSRPFYYREVTGGGVVVSPPPAAYRLAARARRAAAVERVAAVECAAPPAPEPFAAEPRGEGGPAA